MMTEPEQGSAPLTPAGKAEAHRALAEAVRFVLAQLDQTGSLAPESLSPGAVIALGSIVIGRGRAFAQMRGITDPAEQAADVRAMLCSDLESAEMSAAFADVEAEVQGGASAEPPG